MLEFHNIIFPTDIKVFYEDGKPFVQYKGKTRISNDEYEVTIPKLGMELHTLERFQDTEYHYARNPNGQPIACIPISCAMQLYAIEDMLVDLKPIKREMSKKDIEKELGYKVEIIED